MPQVSTIIPTTKRPDLLMRAVASVLMQSFADLEVIVVIDGPNQDTVAALASTTDNRVRVIQNEIALGAAEARNVGVAAALGDWIAFLDDDDQWVHDKIECQLVAAKAQNGPVIVSCLSKIITAQGQYIWPRRIYDNVTPIDNYLFDRKSFFQGEAMLQTSTLLMPRSLFNSLKFNQVHDDWDLVLRAVKHKNVRIITVAKALVVFHPDEERDSVSTTFPWRRSLEWIETNRPLVSRRAYSGFCLTVVGSQAANAKDYSAFPMLLYRAFRRGSPRPIHIALYLIFWIMPFRRRLWLRHFLHRVFSLLVLFLILIALNYELVAT